MTYLTESNKIEGVAAQKNGLPDNAAPVSGDLFARIVETRDTLSRKFKSIVDVLMSNPENFIRKTSRELCAEAGTSEPTLIRFCQSFGYTGLGEFRIDLALALVAKSGTGLLIEPHASDRRSVNFPAKQAIAKLAASLVAEDRTIVFDNGSTVEILSNSIADNTPLTIMTSGLVVAQNALSSGKHSVILTGGRIRPDALSMTGRLVEASIREMRFDTAYLGADSIDPVAGLSTFLEDEAHQTRAMVFAARRVVVLADKSKFHKPSLHWICDLNRVDTLVTDAALDAPEVTAIRRQGVRVLSTQTHNSTS